MKPFNLQQALLGARVITRTNITIDYLYVMRGSTELRVSIGGRYNIYNLDGTYPISPSLDLFLYDEPVELVTKHAWINIYESSNNIMCRHRTKALALQSLAVCGKYITTIPIEWEEEE